MSARCGVPVREKILVFGIEIDGAHRRPGLAELFHEGREIVFIEQNARLGMPQDRAQLGGREADVERHHHGAGLRHAEISFQQPVRVEAEKADAVARLHAGPLQSADASLSQRSPNCGVGEPLRAADDAFFGAIEIDAAMQAAQRRQGNFHGGLVHGIEAFYRAWCQQPHVRVLCALRYAFWCSIQGVANLIAKNGAAAATEPVAPSRPARQGMPQNPGRFSAGWSSPVFCWPCPAVCCRSGAFTSSRISARRAISFWCWALGVIGGGALAQRLARSIPLERLLAAGYFTAGAGAAAAFGGGAAGADLVSVPGAARRRDARRES